MTIKKERGGKGVLKKGHSEIKKSVSKKLDIKKKNKATTTKNDDQDGHQQFDRATLILDDNISEGGGGEDIKKG